LNERNLVIYPWYQAFSSALPWLPVFFLYFLEHLSFTDSITLGAIYYLSVFLFEVPSGYLSDRFGRRRILIAATAMFMLAYGLFLQAEIDTLKALGRESEYAQHEARAHRYAMSSLALSCVFGGALGTLNLAYPYVASFLLAAVSFGLALGFHEDDKISRQIAGTIGDQFQQIAKLLQDKVLLWILVFYVIAYSLQHIPYEFFQPYIKLLLATSTSAIASVEASPWISGIIIGASMFGGALAASISMQLFEKLGLVRLCLLGVVIQLLIVAFLALLLHPAVLLVIVLRNFSMSMTHAPMLAAVAPRVPDAQRATYLSAQSLFGRLSFAVVLWSLSTLGGNHQETTWSDLSRILEVSFFGGLLLLLVLAIGSKSIQSKI